MNRKKIILASVLKPVNDARMYEKFAISLSDNYEVHVVGHAVKATEKHPKIHSYPLFRFHRLSFKRLSAPWKFYKTLIKVKPEVVIPCTHELLIVTVLYKILFGAKILYDIQENYYLNIRYTSSFPAGIKYFIANYVRLKEKLCSRFVNHFILAEKCYVKELPFLRKNCTVIENKYRPKNSINHTTKEPKHIKLLYSGTISPEYGVFEAVELATKLHQRNDTVLLTVVGWSAQKSVREKLKSKIKNLSFITLITDEQPVPHEVIIRELEKADFGLLSYRPNLSTRNCIPTKLFEYTAHKLPMLIENNKLWEEICHKFNSAIFLNYKNFDAENLLHQMHTKPFYNKGNIQEMLWESEETKLKRILHNMLFNN